MIKKIIALLYFAAAAIPVLAGHLDGLTQSGTGFFITADGYFVTSHHVVAFTPRVILSLFN